RIDDEFPGRPIVRVGKPGIGDSDIAEAVFAVDEDRPVALRPGGLECGAGTPGDRRRNSPLGLQEQRIAGGQFYRRIAENGGDPDKIDVRVAVKEKQGHGIVDAGIRVEDDLMHCSYSRMRRESRTISPIYGRTIPKMTGHAGYHAG